MSRISLCILALALAQPASGNEQALQSLNSMAELVATQALDASPLKPASLTPASIGEIPPEPSASSAQSAAPAVGYVPEDALQGGHFDLVAQGPSPADQAYALLVEAEANGALDDAIEFAAQALSHDAKHSRSLLAQGRLLVKVRDYAGAIATLQDLAEASSDDWRPWFWLGTAYLMEGDLAAAATALDEALNRDGEVAAVWIQRALVEQQRNDHRTALQLLGIAGELSPQHPLVLLNLAYSSEALGYVAEAQQAYRKFLTRAYRHDVSNVTRFSVIKHLSEPAMVEAQTNSQASTAPAIIERTEFVAKGADGV